MSEIFVNRGETLTSRESLVLGAAARTFTTVCMLPMTVIKTRFEVSTRLVHNNSSESISHVEAVRAVVN